MARITKAPDERRKEILDTAMKLFCDKGYEKTSISDIAKEINVAQESNFSSIILSVKE